MKRRNFLRKTAAATAGALTLPYILPTGRLFAATGSRVVDHVVFCLFAGGVRNMESVHKADGNLMRNTFTGSESISSDIAGAVPNLPVIGSQRLQQQGTLFREFRFAQGPTGHFNGHNTAITGVYSQQDINIRVRPQTPTVFEMYRKHTEPSRSALNAWWVSNALGPYPALNFSSHPSYGAMYGANFIQPASIVNATSQAILGNPKEFSDVQRDKVAQMRGFFDDNFSGTLNLGDAGVTNTVSDAIQIDDFLQTTFAAAASGQYNNPWGTGFMTGDMRNVFAAEKIIERFKPELLVVNMQDVDICHSNFTQYAAGLRAADYALAHLWQTIQSTPGMANNTILIAAPEHGRNQQPNTVVDAYGRYAIDHTSDAMSREIFCLVVGPTGKVVQGQTITQQVGQSIDIVPTIAHILGFHGDVAGMLPGQVLNQALV